MNTLLGALLTFFTSRWHPLSWVLGAIAVIYGNFLGIMTKIAELIVAVDALARPALAHSAIAVSPLAFVNSILPLDLCVAYFQLYVPFYCVCATVRFIKGFVPTVAA